MRVRRGGAKELKGGNILVKTSGDGTLRGMRCSRCHKLVTASRDGQNRTVYKCICGSTFSARRM